MPTRKEPVLLRGTLRGEGRQRQCIVSATRVSLYVNESAAPVRVEYAGADIADSDDFPDGNYEVVFDGQKALLTRKDGLYLARQ